LMAEIADAAPVVMGLGWRTGGLRSSLAAGLRLIKGFTTGSLVVSPLRFGVIALRHRHYKDVGRLMGAVLRDGAKRRGTGTGATVSASFPPGTARLWVRVAKAYRFAVDRDTAYLDWRYAAHPEHTYSVVHAGPAEAPTALAVCRMTDGRPPAGIISDLLADPHDPESVLHIVEAATDFLKAQGAFAVNVDLPPALADHLMRSSRYKVFRPLAMLIKTAVPQLEGDGIRDPQAWYLSLSDSDQDY
jgi:hypothetical protein